MKLILNGNAKNKQGSRQGIYMLSEKLVNHHPYWQQQNGSNALWFVKEVYTWAVGPISKLGQFYESIIGPLGIDRSPTRIMNGWRYLDSHGQWKFAIASEIMFKDLSPGMHFFKAFIYCETRYFLIFSG